MILKLQYFSTLNLLGSLPPLIRTGYMVSASPGPLIGSFEVSPSALVVLLLCNKQRYVGMNCIGVPQVGTVSSILRQCIETNP